MRFTSTEKIISALQKAGIDASLATTLTDGRLPAIGFSRLLVEDDEIEIGGSKVGGRPDLHPDLAWPCRGDTRWNTTKGNNIPLIFIAQFNLGRMSGRFDQHMGGLLPDKGQLTLFVDIWPDRPDLPEGQLNLKLLWNDGSHQDLVRRDIPRSIAEGYDQGVLASTEQSIKPFSAITKAERLIPAAIQTIEDPLYRAEPVYDNRYLSSVTDVDTDIEIKGASDLPPDAPAATRCIWSDQLGGWATPINRNFRMELNIGMRTLPDLEKGKDHSPVHIITIQGSSQNPGMKMPWDTGNLYIFARRSDIDEGNINETVSFTQQC